MIATRHFPVPRLAAIMTAVLAIGMAPRAESAEPVCKMAPSVNLSLPGVLSVPPVAQTVLAHTSANVEPPPATCNAGPPWRYVAPGTAAAPGTEVLPSGVDGIGLRLFADDAGGSRHELALGRLPDALRFDAPITLGAELVRSTSAATSGRIPAGSLGSIVDRDGRAVVELNLPHPVRLLAPACTVTTARQTVALGDVSLLDFRGIGTAAAAMPLSLSFDCSAHDGQAPEDLELHFSGVADNADPTVLGLQAHADAATGIGIQLLDQGETPILLRNALPVENALDADGTLTVRLHARYIQTQARAYAGIANGIVTFELVYK